MRVAHAVRRIALLALLVVSVGVAAATAPAATDANEAARQALRDGHYARAVELTQQISRVEPGSALNWYRMAIAASRSGQAAVAKDALARAEQLDPSLKFASSRERIEKLRADIRGQLASTPVDAGAPAAAADPDPAAIGGIAQQVTGLQQHIDQRLNQLAGAMASLRAEQDAMARASGTNRVVWIVGFVVVVLIGAFLIALIIERAARARRENDLRDLARLPLPQLIAAARDTHALLLERLEMHGHQKTELYVQLCRGMPSLERESGRAQVRLGSLTGGQPMADVAHAMHPAPKILGRTSAEELHATVLQAHIGNQPSRQAGATSRAAG